MADMQSRIQANARRMQRKQARVDRSKGSGLPAWVWIGCSGAMIMPFLLVILVQTRACGGDTKSHAVLTGHTGYIDIEPDRLITVGSTEDLTRRARQLQIAKDTLGFQQLVQSGLVFRLERGVRVRVIEAGFLLSEIRVESGSEMGRSGFLEPEMISPYRPR